MHLRSAYLYKWDGGPYTTRLTDCSRGTGEGQGEEEEDTEEGQEVETASGRPSRANWHL